MARILILVENLSVPLDRRVWQESLALTADGHEVVVICPMGTRHDTEPHVVLEGISIHRYPLRTSTEGAAGYLREYGLALFHTLRLALRLGRFDVVHLCNPPDLLFVAALPAKLRGAAVVYDQHDLIPELFLSRFGSRNRLLYGVTRLFERLTYATADAVLSTNESYRQVALHRGRKPADRVTVVRSAPDVNRFSPVEPDPALRRGAKHLVGYLGVMGPQDGVDYALRALAHLRHDLGRDDFRAVLLGSGDVIDDMKALARELHLDDVVEFTGYADDSMIVPWLSTADVCLAPDPKSPLNDVSTMNKVVEYMALGRPIVSFDLPESRVSAGDAAVYAPADDVRELGRLVGELLDDPERRAAMGALGRRRVAEELSWEHSRRALLGAYDRLLATRGSRARAGAR